MTFEAPIYVAGHLGLVGSAIARALERAGFQNLITVNRREVDLLDEAAVKSFFDRARPEYVFLAAARVGGIAANHSAPVEFLLENLRIQCNVMESAFRAGVRKLLFLGSSCIYPRLADQPIKEESLLSGPLEPTNEAYAIAKIAGIKLCQAYRREYGADFISVMPTNLYGPNDNFDPESSHVLPSLIRKFHDAKMAGDSRVIVWGTGEPRREFMHVDDLASACLFLMQHYSSPEIINIGWGQDITISELAEKIKRIVGFEGRIVFDASKPDGVPRKLLDTSRITALGWKPGIRLDDGLRQTYAWFRESQASSKASRAISFA